MPNLVKQIPETMRKQGISEKIINQFDIPGSSRPEDVKLVGMEAGTGFD